MHLNQTWKSCEQNVELKKHQTVE